MKSKDIIYLIFALLFVIAVYKGKIRKEGDSVVFIYVSGAPHLPVFSLKGNNIILVEL